ncbi:hypothetical protein KDJ56_14420 [Brevibacillus composti]|uniref:Uncharacterized protein n=1 Tax=Brevibacillus composti TaxID=2796470 RepID=A0A7T5EI91_9BACL|nr:hypothetical protein [Brevibacillus composti]QQE73117.1 hypothetical protein JD108_14475 [Brevibacillus composti]QUO40195.1 hypothetical protein KDJ56_14420 [Brevibacillus composti]
MSDEEIWEYMQRDLDGDLSPDEKSQLHELLLKEPGLQLMYNRMKHVSQQLDQLPPVTPPFSIVDSILPQLEAEKARPAAAISGRHEELPKLEPKHAAAQSAPAEARPKWKKVTLWTARIGSGVVAASLLIGLMLTGGPLKPEPAEDNYQHGSIITPPEPEAPLIVGPPIPPASNHPSPSEEAVEEKTEPPAKPRKPVVNQTPKEAKPSGTAVQTPTQPPKPDPNLPKPPVKPVAIEEEHKPAFPIGIEVPDKEEKQKQKEKEKEEKEKEKEEKDKKKEDDDDDADDHRQNNGNGKEKQKDDNDDN